MRSKVIQMLQSGGVGVIPTDTIYGIVGSALDFEIVQRIYKLRKRNLQKPMIILIANMDDLAFFGIQPNIKTKRILKKLWPGKVSVIMPCKLKEFEYLHRGTKQLAFRLPKLKWLRALLEETGPLVAPSANFEGEPSAKTIREAKKYFGRKIEFYVDAGKLESKPSTLVKIEKGKLQVLREGAVKVAKSVGL